MSAFNDLNTRAAEFAEDTMGEAFSYTSLAGVTTSGLVGVFNQVESTYLFDDHSQRRTVELDCCTSKTQWGATVPANRATITYGGVAYVIDKIDATDTAGDPWFTLRLKRLS